MNQHSHRISEAVNAYWKRGRRTLPFVEAVLEASEVPLSVSEIMEAIEKSGTKMTDVTASKTPHNTIARDLALDIVEKKDDSKFVRIKKTKRKKNGGLVRFTLRSKLP